MTSDSVWPDLTLSSWEETPRHLSHVDAGRRQDPPGAGADGQSLVAGHALRVGARPDDLAHARRRAAVSRSSSTSSITSLDLRTTDGGSRHVALEPRSVAGFYAATMAALDELGVQVTILARPVEVAESIPFARRRAASRVRRRGRAPVLARARADPPRDDALPCAVHRQGRAPSTSSGAAPDLAVTRFSGRPAPQASRRRPELRRLGPGARVQPRGQQLRVLAGRQRRGLVLFLRVSRSRTASPTGRSRPTRPTTTKRSASSCCRTPRSEPPTIPTRCLLSFFQSTYEGAADARTMGSRRARGSRTMAETCTHLATVADAHSARITSSIQALCTWQLVTTSRGRAS